MGKLTKLPERRRIRTDRRPAEVYELFKIRNKLPLQNKLDFIGNMLQIFLTIYIFCSILYTK